MDLQTTDYPVIVGAGPGTKTGVSWLVAVAAGDVGTLPDHTGPDDWPEPLRDLNSWGSGSLFPEKNDGNPYDSETTYSPNGQGGETGGDTVKGLGLMFKPTSKRQATSAYLRIGQPTLKGTLHVFYPDGSGIPNSDPWYTLPCLAVMGYKTPNPQLWDVANNGALGEGQKFPFPGNVNRSGPIPMQFDGADSQWQSSDISSIYNELLNQQGFVAGTSHMLLCLCGIPWYGGVDPVYPNPMTAVLRVTVDMDEVVAAVSNLGTLGKLSSPGRSGKIGNPR